MRLVMMGTGPFGAPTLRSLYDTHHIVVSLVTGPLKNLGGKEPSPISIVRDIAHEHHTPIFDPEDINAEESRQQIALLKADLLVVCDYGHILSSDSLATARLGGINLHASLLPKYGVAPSNWRFPTGRRDRGQVIHRPVWTPADRRQGYPISGETGDVRTVGRDRQLVRQCDRSLGGTQSLGQDRLARGPVEEDDGLRWTGPRAIKNRWVPWSRAEDYIFGIERRPPLRLLLAGEGGGEPGRRCPARYGAGGRARPPGNRHRLRRGGSANAPAGG